MELLPPCEMSHNSFLKTHKMTRQEEKLKTLKKNLKQKFPKSSQNELFF